MDIDVEEIRKHFPIFDRFRREGIVYLDNAATTQKPREVVEAITSFYYNSNSNVHRGVYRTGEEATELYNHARENIASFTGARPEELVFVRNATEALNIAANNLPDVVGRDSEVIISRMEHHSNIVPWHLASTRYGIRVKMMENLPDRQITWEDIEKNLTKKTRIVSLSQCSNILGTINDLSAIGKRLHELGIIFVVDAAQSVPHMPVDVKKLNCDLLAFSGHKMLGPSGIGCLYGTSEILEKMSPYMGGGEMIREVYEDGFTTADVPEKFEAGTPNIEGAIGLSAAVDFLKKIGMDKVRSHEKELIRYTLEKEEEYALESLHSYGPRNPDIRAGIYTFQMKKGDSGKPYGNYVHPHDISHLADRIRGVEIRSGHHCAMPQTVALGTYATARASFYIYNGKEDVDTFFEALKAIEKKMIA